MENCISALGHSLNVDDKVEWMTSGMLLIGEIIGFENDKAKVKTLGFRYSSEEEADKIKSKAKETYKVASKRLFLLKTNHIEK